MARIGILGAGSWGTALAILLHDNGHDVTVWSIHEKEVEMLNTTRRHESKLPGVEIPEGILFTTDMKETMSDKDVCVAGSSFSFYPQYLPENEVIRSCRTDYCECGKGNRRKYPLYSDRYY